MIKKTRRASIKSGKGCSGACVVQIHFPHQYDHASPVNPGRGFLGLLFVCSILRLSRVMKRESRIISTTVAIKGYQKGKKPFSSHGAAGVGDRSVKEARASLEMNKAGP